MPLNQKVVDWAKANGFEKFLGNEVLVNALYAENNKATRLSEVIEGIKVEILMVVIGEPKKSKAFQMCMACRRKECKADTCGKQEYEEVAGMRVKAGDPSSNQTITLNFVPWYRGAKPEPNKIFMVKGIAQLDNRQNLEINVNAIEQATPEMIAALPTPEVQIKVADSNKPVAKSGNAPVTYDEAKNLAIGYFEMNENIRTPQQLKDFLKSKKAEQFLDQIVKDLKLELGEQGYTYSGV